MKNLFIWLLLASTALGAEIRPISTSGGGSGTVTSASVTTANGVSASVATATTTPAFTFTLGAITPSSLSIGSDPADAGSVRLDNAALIAWEASAAGTDLTLTVNASEQFVFSAPILNPSIVGATFTGTINASEANMILGGGGFVFEGATEDDFELTLALVDPTADRTVTLPNRTGTVALNDAVGFPVEFCIALSDETTALTTGTAKVTMRAPYAFTVTAVRASVNTVSSSGIPTADINDGGTTILSTKLTIDASEFTSVSAAAAAVISDSAIADDAELTFDIDVAGTGAKGLKVWIYGTR